MHHDNDVGAGGESLTVAGLLVASVTVVIVVNEHVQPQLLGDFDGAIGAVIVHQDADIHQIRKLADGGFQRLLGVICGHDDGNPFAVDHSTPW